MNGEAVKEIAQLAERALGKIVEIDGVKYSTTPLTDVRKDHLATPLELHTLGGFVDFIKSDIDPLEPEHHAVIVDGPGQVRLVSSLTDPLRHRETVASVVCETLFGVSMKFNVFHELERMIVSLQSLFVPGDDMEKVLRLLGNIRDENVRSTDDDGVTQTVVARAGIVTKQDVEVPNPVVLRPYRTFREVEQPASMFVLRMKTGTDGLPVAGLFEADGGKWQLDAIASIREWLAGHELPLKTLA